ncbi:hypothetical protein TKK_0004346 [Trichogramma kaykai]
MIYHRKKIAEMLLRSGARPTWPNAKRQTPLQIFCMGQRDDADFVETMLELSNGEYAERVAELLARAVHHGLANVTKLLLRKCAEPNFNSALSERFYERWTRALRFFKKFLDDDLSEIISEMLEERQREATDGPALHIVCEKRDGGDDSVQAFFEICDAIGWTVSLDAQDKWGYTALHRLARTGGRKKSAELLLRRGANPDLASKEGSTLLHDICSRCVCFGFPVEMLFEIDEQTQRRRVRLDARDRKGNTSLHLALRHSNGRMVEVLLKNGADPNLTDAEGSTALHFLCKNDYYRCHPCVERLFEICDDNRQFVQIDAKDNLGRTPLQWAVATVKPRAIHALLDRGAVMSRFVFPTESYYGANFDPKIDCFSSVKLIRASKALPTIKILEDAGYELERSDVLIVMKFFAKHRLFEKSPAIEKLLNDEEFVKFAKGKMIKTDLSVYDLILMRPQEAETLRPLLFDSEHERKFCSFPERYQACHMYLCEKMSRKFFRNWALVCFTELINYRLPLECCGIIIDESFTNKDLCNICLATAIES